MTEGWKTARLVEVTTKIGSGATPKGGKNAYKDDGIPLIRSLNVYDNEFRTKNLAFIDDEQAKKLSNVIVAEGDVLINITGASIARCCEAPLKFLPARVNQHVAIIRPMADVINPTFLARLLASKGCKDLLLKVGEKAGATRQALTKNQLQDFEIPLPPLPEQRRIVAILDEAFEGIGVAVANAEKNLANARELFESYLNNVFTQKGEGRVEKKLGDVCGISTKLIDPREPEHIDLPHIGARNMVTKTGILEDIKTAREEGLKSGKFLFDETMVLYSKIRPYLEKVCRPNFKGLCSADVYPLTPEPEHVNKDYLYHMLLCRDFTDYAIQGSDRAGMPKVNRTHLFNYVAWFPSVGQQAELASRLDRLAGEIQHLQTIYQQKLSALTELKESILQKAFAGELTWGIKDAQTTKVAKPTVVETTSPEFTANVLAFTYNRHVAKQRHKTFGHVKAQKTLHLVESISGIDLGRNSIKDAAGPNDFPHMRKAEVWARENQFFEFVKRGEGYEFRKLARYNEMIGRALEVVKPYVDDVGKVIDLLVPMNKEEAEVFATVHAAWNNLILDGSEINDEAIIRAARDNWHSDKLKIAEHKFRKAIRKICDEGLVPDGKAKRVGGQESLDL